MADYIFRSEEDMKNFASKMAGSAKPGQVYALIGDLGAGKTTFAKGFISSLIAENIPVTSPTFNIVQIYNAPDFDIYHCDLYRLKSASELDHLGLEEAFDSAVTLIEWPQIAEHILPKNTTTIKITETQEGDRQVSVQN